MRPGTAVLAVLILAAGCDSGTNPVAQPASMSSNVVEGPVNAATGTWTLDLNTGVGSVHIGMTDLHGPLYRIAVPAGSSGHPVASANGTTVGVDVVGASTSIDITLNQGTPWKVRLSAGASALTVDAGQGTLAGLETLAGVSAVDVTAATPHGIVNLRDVGGSSSFDLHVPRGTGVQVNALGGASDVTLFGRTHSGVAGGSQFQTDGFGGSGYIVDAEAGVSSIVVDPSG